MSEIASVFFYIGTFTLSALLVAFGHKRRFKLAIIIGLAIPILVGGLRYMVGTDYPAYMALFETYSQSSIGDYIESSPNPYELGYYILIKLCSILGLGVNGFFSIAAILTVGFLYFGLKNFKPKYIGTTYLLLLLIILPITFNLVRQGIAIAMVFYALSFMYNGKIKPFVVTTLLASSFHISSILILAVYPFRLLMKHADIRTIPAILKIIAISIATFLISLVLFSIISYVPIFEKYLIYESDMVAQGANLTLYLKLLIFVFILAFSSKLIKADKKNVIIILLVAIDLALTFTGFYSAFIKRIALFFSPFQILALVKISELIKHPRKAMYFNMGLIIYALGFFVLSFFILGQSDIIPYRFIGEGNG